MNTGTNDGKSATLEPDGAALIAEMLGGAGLAETPAAATAATDGEQGAEGLTDGADGSEETAAEAQPEIEGGGEGAGAEDEELAGETAEDPDAAAEGADVTGKEGEEEDLTPALKGLNPKLQERINKRIGKEVGKRKEIETELARVKGEFEALQADRSTEAVTALRGTVFDPAEQHPRLAQLRGEASRYEKTLAVADRMLAQLETAPEKALEQLRASGVQVEDAEKAAQMLERLQAEALQKKERLETRAEIIGDEVRGQIEARRTKFESEAEELYPWLKDSKSAEFAEFSAVLKEAPWVTAMPAGRLLLAGGVTKLRELRLARAAKGRTEGKGLRTEGGKPAVPANKPKVPPLGAGKPAAAPASGRSDGRAALRQQVLKDPTNHDARVGYMGSLLAEAKG